MSWLNTIQKSLPRTPSKDERGPTMMNPLKLIASLTLFQWGMFLSGWFAWVSDAVDFFAMSLSTTRLAKHFHKPVGSITLAITLTLLFRPLGAFIFGLASDRYGRKWPLIANLIVIGSFSLGSGLCQTWSAFLAMRSLFGIAMGGIWGLAVSQGLENLPVECRGLFSGFLQLGYPVGYLIIASVNLNKVVARQENWRYLFYVGSGFSFACAIFRALLPESAYFRDHKAKRDAAHAENHEHNDGATEQRSANKVFLQEFGRMLKAHWLRCAFGILLMTGMNFYSHGSQDLYPTYLQVGKGFDSRHTTLATITGNCGAIAGCAIGGYISQYLGRRLTIIGFCVFCCAMLPLWLLPTSFGGLAAGAAFVQAGVQGAYGVIPIYLSEISPPAFRAMWPGVAYQIGNMISSASAQIEATAGAKLQNPKTGRPEYGKVSAILIAVAASVIILCCLFGNEKHGANFETQRFESDAQQPDANKLNRNESRDDDDLEKGAVVHLEHANARR